MGRKLNKDSYSKLDETFKLADKNGINIAFSSISFEVWYLLHFTFTTRPWSNYSDIKKELCKYISDYDKSNSDMYEKLKDKTSTAIINAKKLREHYKPDLDAGKPVYELDSYTNVDELVELLLNEE